MPCNLHYSPAIHLSPGDITFLPSFRNPECMSVRMKVSKTDPFRSRQTTITYLSSQGTTAGFQHSQYAGHSYRIGAASTSAAVGLSLWLIKTLDRWSSDCYERHIHCPHALLFGVSRQLLDDTFN